jgi:mevalonate kinase
MAWSQECFEGWGLLPPEAKALARELKAQGALATKLTGAGSGGMIVALWAETEV